MHRFALLASVGSLLIVAACFGGQPAQPTVLPTAVPVAASAPPLPPAVSALPTSPPTATPAPLQMFVAYTEGEGVTVRREPGGERLTVWPEGTEVQALGENRLLDGRSWSRVRGPENLEGWVASEFLVDAVTFSLLPTSEPRPAIVEATPDAGPTAPLPQLRPTFTPSTGGPAPTAGATVPAAVTPTRAAATTPGAASTPPAGPTIPAGATPPAVPKPVNPGITPILPPLQR